MINIAVPNYKFLEPMLYNLKKVEKDSNIRVLEVNPNECFDLFLRNSVDLALFTPLDYGKIIKNADVRIVPQSCFALEGYTGVFSFYFKSGLENINDIPSPMHEDYLSTIFKIVLAEKYEIYAELIKSKNSISEMLDEYKLCFHYGSDDEIANSMDLSEEWFDSYESILPVCFWVVRNEEEPENLEDFLISIKQYYNEEIIPVSKPVDDVENRTGNIIIKWNDEIEKSLESVLDMLYFYQYIPEIPEIKLLGEHTIGSDEINDIEIEE